MDNKEFVEPSLAAEAGNLFRKIGTALDRIIRTNKFNDEPHKPSLKDSNMYPKELFDDEYDKK